MTFLSTSLIALITAAFGGWLGFYLAKRRDNRLRTVDLAMRILDSDFTKRRLDSIALIKHADAERLKQIANPKNGEFADHRKAIFEIFNTYELICLLRNKGDLDVEIFEKEMKPIIQDDYHMIDGFLAAVEQHQLAAGSSLRRPYFTMIAKHAGRVRPETAEQLAKGRA